MSEKEKENTKIHKQNYNALGLQFETPSVPLLGLFEIFEIWRGKKIKPETFFSIYVI